MFAAHGIAAVIGAENHAGMLGGLGGGFLSLDIWVDGEDQEEAAALLGDFRDREGSEATDDEDGDGEHDAADADVDEPGARDAADAAEDAAGTFGARHAADAAEAASDALGDRARSPSAADSVRLRVERRRRTGSVLLLGCFLTFGTAHMFTRAWGRGILLACLELAGLRCAWAHRDLGAALVAAAVLGDVIGALWRVRTAPRSTLPTARLHDA
jgi:hypothetical protein